MSIRIRIPLPGTQKGQFRLSLIAAICFSVFGAIIAISTFIGYKADNAEDVMFWAIFGGGMILFGIMMLIALWVRIIEANDRKRAAMKKYQKAMQEYQSAQEQYRSHVNEGDYLKSNQQDSL